MHYCVYTPVCRGTSTTSGYLGNPLIMILHLRFTVFRLDTGKDEEKDALSSEDMDILTYD